MTLTEFLLARIAEDEARADRSLQLNVDGAALVAFGDPDNPPILVVTPARVLAVCEAHRRIVEHPPYRREEGADSDSAYEEWVRVVKILALPHAEHPDFREEWRL